MLLTRRWVPPGSGSGDAVKTEAPVVSSSASAKPPQAAEVERSATKRRKAAVAEVAPDEVERPAAKRKKAGAPKAMPAEVEPETSPAVAPTTAPERVVKP